MLKDSRIYSVGRLGVETCKRHGRRAPDEDVGAVTESLGLELALGTLLVL